MQERLGSDQVLQIITEYNFSDGSHVLSLYVRIVIQFFSSQVYIQIDARLHLTATRITVSYQLYSHQEGNRKQSKHPLEAKEVVEKEIIFFQ